MRGRTFPCRIVGATLIRLDIGQMIQIRSPLMWKLSPRINPRCRGELLPAARRFPNVDELPAGRVLVLVPLVPVTMAPTKLNGATTSPDSLTNCTTKCTTRNGKLDLGSVD